MTKWSCGELIVFLLSEIQSEIVLKKKIVENDVDGDANRMILMMLK